MKTLLGVLAFVCLSFNLQATFSIAAAEKRTDGKPGFEGAALASCTGWLESGKSVQPLIYQSVKGKAAILGQAFYFGNKKEVFASMIEAGIEPGLIMPCYHWANLPFWDRTAAPQEICATYKSQLKDFFYNSRQYSIVPVQGEMSVHTGASNLPLIGVPQTRSSKPFENSVIESKTANSNANFEVHGMIAGNTITSQKLFENIYAEVTSQPHDSFEELLLRSLEAGKKDNEGDDRCVNQTGNFLYNRGGRVAATEAFLIVNKPDGSPLVYLRVKCWPYKKGSPCSDAVDKLREVYNAWRAGGPHIVNLLYEN